MSNARYWPSMTDYQEALQAPAVAFMSGDLRACDVVENNLGLPRPICGTFASVYELVEGRRHWAIKCFLRNTPDLHERYAKIAAHLRRHKRLRYFVDFEYLEEAIRVRGQLFPLVKMEWIDACQLNTYIENNLDNPRMLDKLSGKWTELIDDLQRADIAHGDLQHGNVLVLPGGDLRLIDYDGMWVPALEGQGSNETGHPNFQNPRRTQEDYHRDTDRFSAAVIQAAIRALGRDPGLWQQYNNGDNVLFRRSDFLDPGHSPLLADLRALGDDRVEEELDLILGSCQPNKRTVARSKLRGGSQGAGASTSWLHDHVEDFNSQHDTGRASSRLDDRDSSDPVGLLKMISWFFRT